MVPYLLLASTVLLLCVLFNNISDKLGIPMLLSFILLGMIFGSEGILNFSNFQFTEQISTTALILIMFYGGFGTKWKEAKPVAPQAILLSSIGSVLTAFLLATFCHFALKIQPIESLLIGSVICSTDAASVFSILRANRLNFKYNTASLLEVESGSNDPASYMLTIICLTLMTSTISASSIAVLLIKQVIIGLIFGFAISYLTVWVFNKTKLIPNGFESIFLLSIAVLAYAATTLSGGNGFLAVYITGILLGNKITKKRQVMVHFFDSATNLMQIVLFFFLGLLSQPSRLPSVFIPSLLIALFLTFVARPLAIFSILTPFRSPFRQQLIVAWSGLRGAASIAFAILIVLSGVQTDNDIFNIVFCVVLFSIFFQGSLIPFISRKLDMIDKDFDVMRTFNDYQEEIPITYLSTRIVDSHPWKNKEIKNIILPPQTLILMIVRDGVKKLAKGNTVLLENDIVIFSGSSVENSLDINLYEKILKKNDEWVGKMIKEISFKDELIVIIKRNDRLIVPSGNIMLQEKDSIVICDQSALED